MWVHMGTWTWGAHLLWPHLSVCSAFGFPHKQKGASSFMEFYQPHKKTEMYGTPLSPGSISLYLLQSQALLRVLRLHSSVKLTASCPHGKPVFKSSTVAFLKE